MINVGDWNNRVIDVSYRHVIIHPRVFNDSTYDLIKRMFLEYPELEEISIIPERVLPEAIQRLIKSIPDTHMICMDHSDSIMGELYNEQKRDLKWEYTLKQTIRIIQKASGRVTYWTNMKHCEEGGK
jgi:hypothetical protein